MTYNPNSVGTRIAFSLALMRALCQEVSSCRSFLAVLRENVVDNDIPVADSQAAELRYRTMRLQKAATGQADEADNQELIARHASSYADIASLDASDIAEYDPQVDINALMKEITEVDALQDAGVTETYEAAMGIPHELEDQEGGDVLQFSGNNTDPEIGPEPDEDHTPNRPFPNSIGDPY